VVKLWFVFLSQDGGCWGVGLVAQYQSFHIGKEDLATKAVSIIELHP
jgi:hypothetical protein